MTLLCILAPVAGVIIVILFDLYWLFRLIYLTIFLVLSYLLLEIERLAAWHTHLNDLLEVEGAVKKTRERLRDLRRSFFRIGDSRKFLDKFKTYYSEKRHLVTLERLQKHPIDFPPPNDIHHLVIIPFYREGVKILEPTIQALTRVNYPLKRITVALGVEDRAGEGARKLAEGLKAEYGPQFGHFEVSVHPQNLPGESAVKGANATHAARWAKSYFEERKISLEHVIVSCFDCDTIVSPGYFSCLTYNFLIHPKRTRTSFQPIPVYHNNIWEAPSFACVVETGSSFIQLIEVTDPEQLVTFSSHSMSFQALVEIGYWPIDLISDDSAIFWKAFLAFDGDYRVQPLYVTLSMDVAVGGNLWETCQSIYRQKRRWAWGVENFPILVRGLLANSRISLFQKVRQAFRLLEMNVSWATWTPIMLILSWAPALFATREFAASVAHFNAPRVAGVIGSIAAASLVISIILSFSLLPKRPKPTRILQKFFLALQWLLVPVIATVFGALPALDAQTRLAFGRYMEFFVAPKRASEEERAKTLVGQTSGSRNEPDRRLHG
jgi:cellulose synthase/poly-beta-1,6-N-acetylglucosamine synthase-like glycosyltransferase